MEYPESRLNGRVIFVEGAPRSGTTALAAMLGGHSEVAGVLAESHLFDIGFDRLFDNFEGRGGHRPHLQSFLDREEFTASVRAFSDRVLGGVIDSEKFVVDKTPAPRREAALSLSRKLECFPDAFYIHILRDRDEVVDSLMRAAWNHDKSRGGAVQWWEEATRSIDSILSPHERYIEVRFEDLRAEPVVTIDSILDFVDLASDAAVRDRVQRLSEDRYADHRDFTAPDEGQARRPWSLARSLQKKFSSSSQVDGITSPCDVFAAALRSGGREELAAACSPQLEVHLRGTQNDGVFAGDPAMVALIEVAGLLGGRVKSETWATSTGEPFSTVLISQLGSDGRRLDASCSLLVRGGLVERLNVIVAVGP